MSMNRVIVTGNLTRDCELKSTSGGMAILKIGLAVNDRVKEGDEWKDRANYFDVTVFGKRAEALAGMLAKGSKIAVDGRLRWSSWETDDGSKRSKVEIVADDIELLTPKSQDGYQGTTSRANTPPADDDTDPIPF